jgi:hypothetical protein
MARILRLALTLLLPIAGGAQQTIILRDGTQLSGRLTQATDSTLILRDRNGGIHTLDFDRVDSVQFEHGNAPSSPANAPNGNNAGDNRGYSAAPGTGFLSLAAGTDISVRTNQAINTQSTTESRSFSAQVGKDVVDTNGNLAIPRGSGARLVVRRLNDGVLVLDLQSVSVNGQRYLVDTGSVVPEGDRKDGVGANQRTAEYGGGGAVLGTLLGAIAGGGNGAAIGALAGGAVGVGTEIATRGPIIRVPAETVLNFRLDNKLSLRPAQ